MRLTDIDELPGLRLIRPRRFTDARGDFAEVWQRSRFTELGLPVDFMQDNEVRNPHAGTLRGLHWQAAPWAQAKLVRAVTGAIFDVAVDIDPTRPTFGHWFGATLSADAGDWLFIPAGYAHGYVTLETDTIVHYKVDAPWHPAAERALRWNDATLAIDWPLARPPRLSPKDEKAPSFEDAFPERRPYELP